MSIWVIGQGDIGWEITQQLRARKGTVLAISRRELSKEYLPSYQCDVADEEQAQQLIEEHKTELPELIINTCGFLHDENNKPEKTIRQFSYDNFHANCQANLCPTLNLAKYLSKAMKREHALKFVSFSARVGSIHDNFLGGWHSYRMTKAALNMLIKNIGIEWQQAFPKSCVIGYHPGTVDTKLSSPYTEHVPEEKLFTPDKAASYCLALIDQLKPEMSGCVYDWAQKQIPG